MQDIKISYNTLVYADEDISEGIARLARFGYDGVDFVGEPLEGVNKIAKTIENKGFSRKGKADGKNFVRWKPLHILERCKEKRQGKTAVRHGLGIVFKL